MEDIKTKNDNGLSYLQLDDLKIGDVFSYVSSRGILRHYVVSYLFTSMKIHFAVIIFPDGFAESVGISEVKKDKFEKNIKDWTLIASEYEKEANMYK